MSSEKIKILITGAGAPGAPGIISCLKKWKNIELLVADADANATGRYLNERFQLIPKASDPDFITSLHSLAVRENIQVIMPLVTRELEPLAEHIDLFNNSKVTVLVSNGDALKVANNKVKLYTHLLRDSISVTDFRAVTNVDELIKAFEVLGYPNKKVCIKPAISNGSRGFRIIDANIDEFDLLLNEKPDSTYISYEKLIEIFSHKKMPELLVSEYLPGPEYSIDCLAEHGVTKIAVPRKRTRMLGGISVRGIFEKNEELINYATRIIQSVGLHGNIGIQVKQASDGSFKILEVNPRVQGTIAAGLGAGINLPLLAVKQALNIPIDEKELQVKWGTQFSRYWTEVYY